MMKSIRMFFILCSIVLLTGIAAALANSIPGSQAFLHVRSVSVAESRMLAANDLSATPLPSPIIGDEPADTGGSFLSTGAVIAIILAVLLIVALLAIRLWKKRSPGRSGQNTP